MLEILEDFRNWNWKDSKQYQVAAADDAAPNDATAAPIDATELVVSPTLAAAPGPDLVPQATIAMDAAAVTQQVPDVMVIPKAPEGSPQAYYHRLYELRDAEAAAAFKVRDDGSRAAEWASECDVVSERFVQVCADVTHGRYPSVPSASAFQRQALTTGHQHPPLTDLGSKSHWEDRSAAAKEFQKIALPAAHLAFQKTNTLLRSAVRPADFRPRVYLMLATYAPNKLGDVDALMPRITGQEERFIAMLVERYGPEPTMPAEVLETQSSEAVKTTNRSYKDRLSCLLQHYAPEKLPKVDELLAKAKGREEKMMLQLTEKYGPEPPPPGPPPPPEHALQRLLGDDEVQNQFSSFVNKTGLFVHVWANNGEARRYFAGSQRVFQAIFDARLEEVAAPFTMLCQVQGSYVTVTTLCPIDSTAAVDPEECPVSLCRMQYLMRALRLSCTETQAMPALYNGGDLRRYVTHPERALRKAPPLPASAGDVPPVPHESNSAVRPELLNNLCPTLLKTTEAGFTDAEILAGVQKAIAQTASTLKAELVKKAQAAKAGGGDADVLGSAIKESLCGRVFHRCGLNMRFAFRVLMPFMSAQNKDDKAAQGCARLLVNEMTVRTIKELIRVELWSPEHILDVSGLKPILDRYRVDLVNRTLACLVLKGEKQFDDHVLPVMRRKFGCPAKWTTPFNVINAKAVVNALTTRLGLSFDSATKRFSAMGVNALGATGVVPPPAIRHMLRGEQKEATASIGQQFEAARQTNSEVRIVEWCRLLLLDSGLKLPETGTHLDMLRTGTNNPSFKLSVAIKAVAYYSVLTCMLPLFSKERHTELLRGIVDEAIAAYDAAVKLDDEDDGDNDNGFYMRLLSRILDALNHLKDPKATARHLVAFVDMLVGIRGAHPHMLSVDLHSKLCAAAKALPTTQVDEFESRVPRVRAFIRGSVGEDATRAEEAAAAMLKMCGSAMNAKAPHVQSSPAMRDFAQDTVTICRRLYGEADDRTVRAITYLGFFALEQHAAEVEAFGPEEVELKTQYRDAAFRLHMGTDKERKKDIRAEWFTDRMVRVCELLVKVSELPVADLLCTFNADIAKRANKKRNVEALDAIVASMREATEGVSKLQSMFRKTMKNRGPRRQVWRETVHRQGVAYLEFLARHDIVRVRMSGIRVALKTVAMRQIVTTWEVVVDEGLARQRLMHGEHAVARQQAVVSEAMKEHHQISSQGLLVVWALRFEAAEGYMRCDIEETEEADRRRLKDNVERFELFFFELHVDAVKARMWRERVEFVSDSVRRRDEVSFFADLARLISTSGLSLARQISAESLMALLLDSAVVVKEELVAASEVDNRRTVVTRFEQQCRGEIEAAQRSAVHGIVKANREVALQKGTELVASDEEEDRELLTVAEATEFNLLFFSAEAAGRRALERECWGLLVLPWEALCRSSIVHQEAAALARLAPLAKLSEGELQLYRVERSEGLRRHLLQLDQATLITAVCAKREAAERAMIRVSMHQEHREWLMKLEAFSRISQNAQLDIWEPLGNLVALQESTMRDIIAMQSRDEMLQVLQAVAAHDRRCHTHVFHMQSQRLKLTGWEAHAREFVVAERRSDITLFVWLQEKERRDQLVGVEQFTKRVTLGRMERLGRGLIIARWRSTLPLVLLRLLRGAEEIESSRVLGQMLAIVPEMEQERRAIIEAEAAAEHGTLLTRTFDAFEERGRSVVVEREAEARSRCMDRLVAEVRQGVLLGEALGRIFLGQAMGLELVENAGRALILEGAAIDRRAIAQQQSRSLGAVAERARIQKQKTRLTTQQILERRDAKKRAAKERELREAEEAKLRRRAAKDGLATCSLGSIEHVEDILRRGFVGQRAQELTQLRRMERDGVHILAKRLGVPVTALRRSRTKVPERPAQTAAQIEAEEGVARQTLARDRALAVREMTRTATVEQCAIQYFAAAAEAAKGGKLNPRSNAAIMAALSPVQVQPTTVGQTAQQRIDPRRQQRAAAVEQREREQRRSIAMSAFERLEKLRERSQLAPMTAVIETLLLQIGAELGIHGEELRSLTAAATSAAAASNTQRADAATAAANTRALQQLMAELELGSKGRSSARLQQLQRLLHHRGVVADAAKADWEKSAQVRGAAGRSVSTRTAGEAFVPPSLLEAATGGGGVDDPDSIPPRMPAHWDSGAYDGLEGPVLLEYAEAVARCETVARWRADLAGLARATVRSWTTFARASVEAHSGPVHAELLRLQADAETHWLADLERVREQESQTVRDRLAAVDRDWAPAVDIAVADRFAAGSSAPYFEARRPPPSSVAEVERVELLYRRGFQQHALATVVRLALRHREHVWRPKRRGDEQAASFAASTGGFDGDAASAHVVKSSMASPSTPSDSPFRSSQRVSFSTSPSQPRAMPQQKRAVEYARADGFSSPFPMELIRDAGACEAVDAMWRRSFADFALASLGRILLQALSWKSSEAKTQPPLQPPNNILSTEPRATPGAAAPQSASSELFEFPSSPASNRQSVSVSFSSTPPLVVTVPPRMKWKLPLSVAQASGFDDVRSLGTFQASSTAEVESLEAAVRAGLETHAESRVANVWLTWMKQLNTLRVGVARKTGRDATQTRVAASRMWLAACDHFRSSLEAQEKGERAGVLLMVAEHLHRAHIQDARTRFVGTLSSRERRSPLVLTAPPPIDRHSVALARAEAAPYSTLRSQLPWIYLQLATPLRGAFAPRRRSDGTPKVPVYSAVRLAHLAVTEAADIEQLEVYSRDAIEHEALSHSPFTSSSVSVELGEHMMRFHVQLAEAHARHALLIRTALGPAAEVQPALLFSPLVLDALPSDAERFAHRLEAAWAHGARSVADAEQESLHELVTAPLERCCDVALRDPFNVVIAGRAGRWSAQTPLEELTVLIDPLGFHEDKEHAERARLEAAAMSYVGFADRICGLLNHNARWTKGAQTVRATWASSLLWGRQPWTVDENEGNARRLLVAQFMEQRRLVERQFLMKRVRITCGWRPLRANSLADIFLLNLRYAVWCKRALKSVVRLESEVRRSLDVDARAAAYELYSTAVAEAESIRAAELAHIDDVLFTFASPRRSADTRELGEDDIAGFGTVDVRAARGLEIAEATERNRLVRQEDIGRVLIESGFLDLKRRRSGLSSVASSTRGPSSRHSTLPRSAAPIGLQDVKAPSRERGKARGLPQKPAKKNLIEERLASLLLPLQLDEVRGRSALETSLLAEHAHVLRGSAGDWAAQLSATAMSASTAQAPTLTERLLLAARGAVALEVFESNKRLGHEMLGMAAVRALAAVRHVAPATPEELQATKDSAILVGFARVFRRRMKWSDDGADRPKLDVDGVVHEESRGRELIAFEEGAALKRIVVHKPTVRFKAKKQRPAAAVAASESALTHSDTAPAAAKARQSDPGAQQAVPPSSRACAANDTKHVPERGGASTPVPKQAPANFAGGTSQRSATPSVSGSEGGRHHHKAPAAKTGPPTASAPAWQPETLDGVELAEETKRTRLLSEETLSRGVVKQHERAHRSRLQPNPGLGAPPPKQPSLSRLTAGARRPPARLPAMK